MVAYAQIYPDTSDMGTTVVAALIANEKYMLLTLVIPGCINYIMIKFIKLQQIKIWKIQRNIVKSKN